MTTEHPAATAERQRIVALLLSYETQIHAQIAAMHADGMGDPRSLSAQLDMLRLLVAMLSK